MFDIASPTEALYSFELPLCVKKLTEKAKRFEPSTSADNIATFVLGFLDIFLIVYFIGCTLFRNIYYFMQPVTYLSQPQDSWCVRFASF